MLCKYTVDHCLKANTKMVYKYDSKGNGYNNIAIH